MRCSKCGKEVSIGDIFCSKCGSEIQIVPDYNVFGDEFSDVMQQSESYRAQEEKENEEKMKAAEKKAKDNKRKNIAILCITLSVILFIAIALVITIFVTSGNNKKSFNYNFTKAEESLKSGNLSEALQYVNDALSADENNIYAGLLKAEILAEQDKYKESIRVLRDIIELYPDNLKAYNLIIEYCIEVSDYDTISELAESVKEQSIYALFEDYLADAPKFSIKAGNYDEVLTLTLTTSEGAQIYYTTDGTSPKNFGVLYTGEITLEEGMTTVRAYATNDFGVVSEEVEATYFIAVSLPDKPEVSVPSGTYTEEQLITIYVPVGWSAYYTWDDTTPTEESIKYEGPFEMIPGNNVLRIVFINDEEPHRQSEVAQYHYVYTPGEGEADDSADESSDDSEDENE